MVYHDHIWRDHDTLIIINIISTNKIICLAFIETMQVVDIFPRGRQRPVYATWSIPLVVVVTLFSNIIHEQNTSNTNLTNKVYPGYCKHVLCWRPPEKALAYLAGGNPLLLMALQCNNPANMPLTLLPWDIRAWYSSGIRCLTNT